MNIQQTVAALKRLDDLEEKIERLNWHIRDLESRIAQLGQLNTTEALVARVSKTPKGAR